MAEARRTLVKSPPELWAEVSDPDCLAKHLGGFGEIRITRVEPETTVAWEGDRARGTVELEASGWGTKVRLTAEPVEVAEPALQQPLAAPPEPDTAEEPEEPEAAEEAQAPPEPEEPAAAAPEPEKPAAAAPEPEKPAAAPEPEGAATEEPTVLAPSPRRGFFARFFKRREGEAVVEEPVPEVASTEPEPVAEVATPETEVAEEPAAVVVPPEREPAEEHVSELSPAEPEPEPEPETADEPAAEIAEPAAEGEIRVSRLGEDETVEILDGMLDTLGAAHHRPFSRS